MIDSILSGLGFGFGAAIAITLVFTIVDYIQDRWQVKARGETGIERNGTG